MKENYLIPSVRVILLEIRYDVMQTTSGGTDPITPHGFNNEYYEAEAETEN